MNCIRCGVEMKSTTGDNYTCPKCDMEVNDLVYRPQNCDMPLPQDFDKQRGWICPVCGKGVAPWISECPCKNDTDVTNITTTNKSGWVHLPCKVGDVVYQVTRNFISEFRVRFVEIATCGNLFLHTDLISGIVYTGEVFSESDIGKTVFLAREDAEKTLEEMRKEDEGK